VSKLNRRFGLSSCQEGKINLFFISFLSLDVGGQWGKDVMCLSDVNEIIGILLSSFLGSEISDNPHLEKYAYRVIINMIVL
jgi:hypothetical protein